MTTSNGNPRTVRSDIVFVFALLLTCYVAWLIRDVLIMLYVSALFAVVLGPLVRSTAHLAIGRWHPFRGKAFYAVLLLAIAAASVFSFQALLPVVRDMRDIGGEMPTRLPDLLEKLKHVPFADRLNNAQTIAQLQNLASQAGAYLFHSIGTWADWAFEFAMSIVLTVYFMLEGKHSYQWFLSFFPPPNRDRLDKTLQRAGVRMGRWLIGQGALMLILGITSTIVYLSLHVRYAYALGLLTGLLNIIPVIGGVVAIGLALLVGAMDSWGRVAGIAIFYPLYLWIENTYMIPRIMRTSVNLPGIAILASLLIGSALAGVVGAMVSVPTAVLVAVLVDEYLVNKTPA